MSEADCYAEYGECGVGAYCLGGCDPVNSFSLDACVPAPVCESKTFNFENLDGIVANTKYLGDASTADWVSSGTPLSYNNSVLLTMAEDTVGTLLASTHYIWYGKVTGKFSTSAGAGVVTAFILLGDSKDEIDFEFVGVELSTAQTNFYSQGVTNCKMSLEVPTRFIVLIHPQTTMERMPQASRTFMQMYTPTKSTGLTTTLLGRLMATQCGRSTVKIPGTPQPTAISILKHLADCSCHFGLVVFRPTVKEPSIGLVVLSSGTRNT